MRSVSRLSAAGLCARGARCTPCNALCGRLPAAAQTTNMLLAGGHGWGARPRARTSNTSSSSRSPSALTASTTIIPRCRGCRSAVGALGRAAAVGQLERARPLARRAAPVRPPLVARPCRRPGHSLFTATLQERPLTAHSRPLSAPDRHRLSSPRSAVPSPCSSPQQRHHGAAQHPVLGEVLRRRLRVQARRQRGRGALDRGLPRLMTCAERAACRTAGGTAAVGRHRARGSS